MDFAHLLGVICQRDNAVAKKEKNYGNFVHYVTINQKEEEMLLLQWKNVI